LDHFLSSLGEVKNFLPYVSFVAGVSGSLHCVGMCGGLVTASCSDRTDIFKYQVGRLGGYMSLGLVAGLIGQSFSPLFEYKTVTLIGALMMGGLFIFWGVSNFFGRRAELPVPSFISKLYQNLWGKLIRNNKRASRSFFVGLISILLPCGLLYGVVITTFAMGNFYEAIISMLFFWLGTLPAMVTAPTIIQRFLKPFKNKLPKFYAVGLILIGLVTIYSRLPTRHIDHSHQIPNGKDHLCH